jgi:putative FmdB family regulatory protein
MPVYDYLCARCGPFTDMRPMAHCDRPHGCPKCGRKAPRAYLSAPYCAAMPAERALAHATNERSANAPQRLSDMKAGTKAQSKAHGRGCGCCKPLRPANGGDVRGFPSKRPWMISH